MDEPRQRRFLTAAWRWLVMLNYEVDPDVLADHIPAGTRLDLWRGKALVSMVGFRFLNTRVWGVPVPGHRDFDEVNLRFYVIRDTPHGARRGVVFVKEIVPRAAIAWLARRLYGEKYAALPMEHTVQPLGPGRDGGFEYRWKPTDRWNRLAAQVSGEPAIPDDESEEAFIAEHYWGYSSQRDGSTVEYQVEHPPWRVWRASSPELDCDVGLLYGPRFEPFLSAAPSSAFVAEGSEVLVRRGRRLPA